ncbi:Sorting nexin mvp1 [Mortierella sp. GBA43]|nr:Sorting nexin mvp1 [Mortierella sp. GBA43]
MDLGSILSGMPLPQIYTTAFDLAQPVSGKITVSALNKIVGVSGLPAAAVAKILNIVVAPTQSAVSKGECSVTLALIAMAQKNMDLTVENLLSHRQDLPVPHLPGLDSVDFESTKGADLFSTSSPMVNHPANVGSSVDPWRTSTFSTKSNGGYPPAPSFLESPPLPAPEVPRIANPEATRKEMYQWFLNVDTISIKFAPEKEGIFLFKHTNYIVESKNRATTVIRRYSDFWWMLEVLAKRFPFRILPKLPPKRLGADEAFLERRLRGLTRFMNALVRHPVLRDDPLVVSFLTEPVELAVWRKNVKISTEDEFTTRLSTSESLAKQIPPTLDAELDKVKKRLPPSVEYYRNIVHVVDRVQKRTEASAADYTRYSLALNALADCDKKCHVDECYSCGQLSEGYRKISTHIAQASHLLDDQARVTQRDMIENLKRHRDLLVSMQELMQRRDQSRDGNTIEMLKKRIVTNETKLKALKNSAETAAAASTDSSSASVYGPQIEKITNNINSDRAELENQNKRGILMQHTLWMEITYFHKCHTHIAGMYQAFVHGEMKASQSQFDNWKALSSVVHELPMEVNGFN